MSLYSALRELNRKVQFLYCQYLNGNFSNKSLSIKFVSAVTGESVTIPLPPLTGGEYNVTSVIINDNTKNTGYTVVGNVLTFTDGTELSIGDVITITFG